MFFKRKKAFDNMPQAVKRDVPDIGPTITANYSSEIASVPRKTPNMTAMTTQKGLKLFYRLPNDKVDIINGTPDFVYNWDKIYGAQCEHKFDTGVNESTAKRVTATRLVALGVFALAAPKKKTTREAYDNGGYIKTTIFTTDGNIAFGIAAAQASFIEPQLSNFENISDYVNRMASANPSNS